MSEDFGGLVRKFRSLPKDIAKKIFVDAVKKDVPKTIVENIKTKWLTAPRGYSADKLHVRTGRLRSGVGFRVTVKGEDVEAAIIDKVWYAKLHEEGGTFNRRAGFRTISRMRGTGGRRGRKLLTPIVQRVQSHTVTFPQRAPFRKGTQEALPRFKQVFIEDVVKGINEYLEN